MSKRNFDPWLIVGNQIGQLLSIDTPRKPQLQPITDLTAMSQHRRFTRLPFYKATQALNVAVVFYNAFEPVTLVQSDSWGCFTVYEFLGEIEKEIDIGTTATSTWLHELSHAADYILAKDLPSRCYHPSAQWKIRAVNEAIAWLSAGILLEWLGGPTWWPTRVRWELDLYCEQANMDLDTVLVKAAERAVEAAQLIIDCRDGELPDYVR